MRALLAIVLILGGVLLLSACTSEEEPDEESTSTGTPKATASTTAAATQAATATPGGAVASATPRRDLVRRPNLPTRTATVAPPPVQTSAPPPPVQTAAPPPPVQTSAPPPVQTAAPPVQTATAATPWFEASAPIDPVAPYTTVELSIRNANGAPGETYDVAMLVRLPDQTDSIQQGVVSGSDWTTFYFSDTWQIGFYDVAFGLPQSDYIYAETWFEVADSQQSQPEWQTSAPREAVAAGSTIEVGLRNMWGVSGECYDFTVEVYDPDGYTSSGYDSVCADQWTYLTYSDTWTSGYYDVSWYIGDQFIASDYFQVGY